MGMFDTLILPLTMLPVSEADRQKLAETGKGFQTKSLESSLLDYRITEDGYLEIVGMDERPDPVPERQAEFTGAIRFYDYPYVFTALFHRGRLQEIVGGHEEGIPGHRWFTGPLVYTVRVWDGAGLSIIDGVYDSESAALAAALNLVKHANDVIKKRKSMESVYRELLPEEAGCEPIPIRAWGNNVRAVAVLALPLNRSLGDAMTWYL
jgi:hypothetical protein